jgi:hypothetical protein
MKNRILILLFLQISLYNNFTFCQQNKSTNDRNDIAEIEHLKKHLCYQYLLNDECIRCPDSIWTIKLKESLYLTQSFYGSGYGNGILLNLVHLEKTTIKILDSLFFNWDNDMIEPEKIKYFDSLNWYSYFELSGGTNYHSIDYNIITIEDKKFHTLLTIPKYSSVIDTEETPWTYNSIEVTEIKTTLEEIIFKAKFESGIIINDISKPLRTKEDIVEFEYSDTCKCFLWKKSTNYEFENFWKENYDFNKLY